MHFVGFEHVCCLNYADESRVKISEAIPDQPPCCQTKFALAFSYGRFNLATSKILCKMLSGLLMRSANPTARIIRTMRVSVMLTSGACAWHFLHCAWLFSFQFSVFTRGTRLACRQQMGRGRGNQSKLRYCRSLVTETLHQMSWTASLLTRSLIIKGFLRGIDLWNVVPLGCQA